MPREDIGNSRGCPPQGTLPGGGLDPEAGEAGGDLGEGGEVGPLQEVGQGGQFVRGQRPLREREVRTDGGLASASVIGRVAVVIGLMQLNCLNISRND
ncbi:MAG: hypothetical protein HC924_17805 [Synechococcaceae cyanobacterium SM2_3_2]|nr:hypothetical protein [Synechococcaceae cyanobacterium SM2_3_2]